MKYESIIYRELFLNYLCVTVRGWSSTPVPPGTVSVPPGTASAACGGACGAAFLRQSLGDCALIRSRELHIEDGHGFLCGGDLPPCRRRQ
jgi:hypothetical protein